MVSQTCISQVLDIHGFFSGKGFLQGGGKRALRTVPGGRGNDGCARARGFLLRGCRGGLVEKGFIMGLSWDCRPWKFLSKNWRFLQTQIGVEFYRGGGNTTQSGTFYCRKIMSASRVVLFLSANRSSCKQVLQTQMGVEQVQ